MNFLEWLTRGDNPAYVQIFLFVFFVGTIEIIKALKGKK